MASARVRARLPHLVARDLARRTLAVPDDLPLAEAVRRAQEAQAGGIVDRHRQRAAGRRRQRGGAAGHPGGAASVGARSPPSRARSTTGSGCRPRITGEDLVLRDQPHPAAEYLLVEDDGSIYGVLVDRRRGPGVPGAPR